MKAKKILLQKNEIKKLLLRVDSWAINAKSSQISKTFTFDDHVSALVFIARITVHAQVLNHHPDIEFSFRKVKVTLRTDDIKGLSKLDFELASRIDSLNNGG